MTDVVVLLALERWGGAELSMLAIARGLKDAGNDVTLAVCGKGRHLAPEAASDLTVEDLGAEGSLSAILPLSRMLRARRPDIVLSALRYTNIAAILAAKLSSCGVRVIVTEHTPPGFPAGSTGIRLLTRFFYPLAHAVVAVSRGIAKGLRGNVRVIYNPVTREIPRQVAPPHAWLGSGAPPVIMAIGRLSVEKDFATLLRAVAALSMPLRLVILGEGKERPALEALIRRLGIADRVLLPGFVNNATDWLAHAKLFVSSSRFEGFGNAIVEAMQARVPVIATDCPVGPREILDNGRFGQLVPAGDAEALAAAIAQALDNPPDVEKPYARAQDFSAWRCIRAYRALIDELPTLPSLRQRICRRLCSIMLHENWMTGVVDAPIEQSLTWTSCPGVRWLGSRSRKRYLADPFAWPGRPDVILCEEYDFATRKGSLRQLTMKEEAIALEEKLPMPLPGHLSFPFLFAHEGEVYCLPESGEAGCLAILRWENGVFVPFSTPLGAVAAADSVLFVRQGCFWIGYTDTALGTSDNLNLCFAASLAGPWRLHPENPVRRGAHCSRNGGTPFHVDGTLYRPAQDCSRTYGGAVRIMRVTECTPERYREEEANLIAPEHGGLNPHGFHTLSVYGDKCLVDGKRMCFSLTRVLEKLWRRFKRR